MRSVFLFIGIGIGEEGEIVAQLNLEPAEPIFVRHAIRSEEHTSELQSLMRISYAVFCLKKKNPTFRPYLHRLEEDQHTTPIPTSKSTSKLPPLPPHKLNRN